MWERSNTGGGNGLQARLGKKRGRVNIRTRTLMKGRYGQKFLSIWDTQSIKRRGERGGEGGRGGKRGKRFTTNFAPLLLAAAEKSSHYGCVLASVSFFPAWALWMRLAIDTTVGVVLDFCPGLSVGCPSILRTSAST